MREAQQSVIGLLIGMFLALVGVILIPQHRKPGPSDGVKPLQNVTVVAHRGASKIAPENTMAAFQKALLPSEQGIECDVLFTRNDVPVVNRAFSAVCRPQPASLSFAKAATCGAIQESRPL